MKNLSVMKQLNGIMILMIEMKTIMILFKNYLCLKIYREPKKTGIWSYVFITYLVLIVWLVGWLVDFYYHGLKLTCTGRKVIAVMMMIFFYWHIYMTHC